MENKEKQQFSETQVFERLTNPEVDEKKKNVEEKKKKNMKNQQQMKYFLLSRILQYVW